MGKSGTTKYPKMFNLGSPFKLDPNKRMDKLSAKHKELYDRFEMGQTSESEEQKMYKLEDKMDRVGKRIKKKESPASLMVPTKPKGKMKKEGKLKATMTKTMRKLPTQAAKISGPHKNK